MDLDDEHILVIRAVEDADAPALRQGFHIAPEEIVVEFLGGGFLEAVDLAALGIDAGHDVADGAVLARRIHRLENQQHRVGVAGVEQFLGRIELLAVFRQNRGRPLLDDVFAEFLGVVGFRPVGHVVLEIHLAAGFDEELLEEFWLDHGGGGGN